MKWTYVREKSETGIIAAARKNSTADWLPMSISMLGICLPTFVMGPLLALGLGLKLNLFNVAGWYGWSDRVLPSLTLGLFYAAYIARMTRAGMLEVLVGLIQAFVFTLRSAVYIGLICNHEGGHDEEHAH